VKSVTCAPAAESAAHTRQNPIRLLDAQLGRATDFADPVGRGHSHGDEWQLVDQVAVDHEGTLDTEGM